MREGKLSMPPKPNPQVKISKRWAGEHLHLYGVEMLGVQEKPMVSEIASHRSGQTNDRLVSDRHYQPDIMIVVPLCDGGLVVLKKYCPAVKQWIWTLPEGRVKKRPEGGYLHDIRDIVFRQTGMVVNENGITQIKNKTLTSPFFSDELATVAFATCRRPKSGPLPSALSEPEIKYMDGIREIREDKRIMSTPLAMVVEMFFSMGDMIAKAKPLRENAGQTY